MIRDGVEYTSLAAPSPASIRMVGSGVIKTSFSGTFRRNPACDWLIDRVRPYLFVDGAEYPLGEYVITEDSVSRENGTELVELTGYDCTYLAQRYKLESPLYLERGSRYTDVIQALFVAAGVEKIICEESDAVLLTDREDWEVGTDHLTIANDLLAEINYDSAWADLDGYIRIQRRREPSAENIRIVYNAGELSIIEDACKITNDLHDKCNVFRVEVENPELDEVMAATSVNDDPSHPLNIYRLGRIQAPIERLKNIASQEALQTYADNLKFASMLGSEEITYYTALNPIHAVNDVVAINHPSMQGIYQETEWSLALGAGERMEHKARRVLYL